MSATASGQSLAARLAARGMACAPASWSAAQRAALGAAAPEQCATPSDRAALRELVLEAAVAEESLLPIGGGSALAAGGPCGRVGLAVALAKLDRVVEHSAADFVVTVEAGTRFAALQELLLPHRQWLAIEPPDAERATVGGMIAAQASSFVAGGHGTLRNHLLGVRVLHADGRFAKAGGRVVKNVAGFDLMKLHHGALGTLGLVVEATLRLRPLPECDLALLAPCEDVARVAPFADALVQPGLAPVAGHFVGQWSGGALRGDLIARFQGASAAAHAQADALRHTCGDAAWQREQLLGVALRARPRPLQALAEACSFGDEPHGALLSLHFAPGKSAEALAALVELGAGRVALDLLRGTGSVRMATDGPGGALSQSLAHGVAAFGRALASSGGAAFVLGGPPELRAALPDRAESEGAAKVAKALRDELDPMRRFNPGRRGD
ncbi:MAG: FAD-binding oxidoreductase [Planctomycetes bacterium]|nr:FAD-binding oxidoreductase [Planctomycetota bacterium]